MEWKIDISGITGASIERAKVEAQRATAEQLETLNKTIDTGFGLIIDAIERLKK